MTLHIASQWCAPVGHAEGRSPVKTSSYRERDYAFGQMMRTLATSLGLTQAGLGERLRVSRRAVVEWEGGLSYPTAGHLQALIALGVQQRIFADGREAEVIRALWRAAHQKVLLNGRWLSDLLRPQQPSPPAPQSDEQTHADEQAVAQPALGPRIDRGDALDVPTVYGREGAGDTTMSEAVLLPDQPPTTTFFIPLPSPPPTSPPPPTAPHPAPLTHTLAHTPPHPRFPNTPLLSPWMSSPPPG